MNFGTCRMHADLRRREKARVIGFSLLSITREREAEFRIALPFHGLLGKGLGEEVTRAC